MQGDGQFDVFLHRESRQQCTTLKQYTPLLVGAGLMVSDFLPQDFDLSFVRPVQTENAA